MGDRWGNIASDVQKDLLEHRCIEPCAGDADLIQAMRGRNGGLGQFNAFTCRQATADHQGDASTVAFEMDHELAKLTHPHGTSVGFLRAKKTPAEGNDVHGAHGFPATRPCFHPIPFR